jgi:hypothetical protein
VVSDLGFMVQGQESGFRVQSSGSGAGSSFRVHSLGFRV